MILITLMKSVDDEKGCIG